MKKTLFALLLAMLLVGVMAPGRAFAREWTTERTITNGWYYLRCMYNYLNITKSGAAELRNLSANEAYYVESKGGSKYTLRLKDGRYLGLDGTRQNGTRLNAVNSPYTWLVYWEATSFNTVNPDLFSLRPPEALKMLVNASGEKNADGTSIIIWTHEKLDAPNHAEFRFLPASRLASQDRDATGASWSVYTEKGLAGYKDQSGNVLIKAQFDSAERFSMGIAKVYSKAKGAAAYIDTEGKLITPYKYDSAASGTIVYDGLMRVAIDGPDVVNAIMNGDGVAYSESVGTETSIVMKSGNRLKYEPKFGFIDTKGNEVIPLQFYEAYSFQDGRAAVLQYQGATGGYKYSKLGYIDTSGKLVIPYKYGGENLYDGSALSYKDGLAVFFEYLGKDGFGADARVLYPPAGIMDRQGKVVIPSNPDRWYPTMMFGLLWEDGIIVNSYSTETDKEGTPAKKGGYEWSFVELYDYSGKLVKKLDGYVYAFPVDGGYVIALHQLRTNSAVCHWSVFDRNGRIVLDNLKKNNPNILGSPYGYENGYLYFAGEGYKLPRIAAPLLTAVK